MGALSDEMKRVVERQRLGFVATVCPDGTPNLSPKGTVSVLDDDHLVFADIRSPGTVANLRANPSVEVNVVDPFVRKGYRFKGPAVVHEPDTDGFAEGLIHLESEGFRTSPDRVKAIVVIEVRHAAPLVSPAYDDGARSEAEITAAWREHFALQHPPDEE